MNSSIESSGGKPSLIAFSLLQIVGGQVGMLFILFSAFISSERVRRHPCFLNFAVSWFLYSFSYTLLLYGGEIYNPNPPHGLCVAQAAFTYGAAPMASIASFMFVFQIYLSLNRILSNNVAPRSPAWNLTLLLFMLGSPYVVLLVMLIAVPVYAHHHPADVERIHFYCHINNKTFGNIPPGIAGVGIIASLVVLALLSVKVYRNWGSFRRLDNRGQDITFGLIIRALIFVCFAIIAILICAALIGADDQDMLPLGTFLALLPMAVFIVFGIQRDICQPFHRSLKKKESLQEVIRVVVSVPLEVTVTQTVSKSSTL